MADRTDSAQPATPWNKGKLIGRKPPLRLQEIWNLRTRLQMAGRTRELALFNLALDGKLRGCDLVRLRVRDLAHGESVLGRTSVCRRRSPSGSGSCSATRRCTAPTRAAAPRPP
ncbi:MULTISPECIES: hypothetical protein [unclassified Thiocapsa]|uniref:hypothetical protein n=1 Tax=unclassified Thiocapsa TaxID=2641286 RepID=UPI0035B05B77